VSFSSLTNENFLLYAAKAYDTPSNVVEEFHDDLKRIKYIKRQFRRYRATGDLADRLILNHLIVLYNVFGNAATRMLFFRVDVEDYSALKTFLLFLGRLPTIVTGIDGSNIDTGGIDIDAKVVKILRKL
jgi:hypothetical protein